MIQEHTFAILAYKESSHLQECLDSLKNQSRLSNILLCTSTPSVFLDNIAQKNNISLFINPTKNGIADDWNFALNQTKTKYVTLAHQDDVYHPKYLENILEFAEKKEDSLLIFTDYDEIVCKENKTCVRQNSLNFFIKRMMLWPFFIAKSGLTKNKTWIFKFGNPIGCPTVTFCKKNIDNFKFDASFSVNLDWKAWYDLAQKNGSFVWVKKILVSHRIYPESETSIGLRENRRQEEDLRIFTKLWPNYIAKILNKFYSLSYKNNHN